MSSYEYKRVKVHNILYKKEELVENEENEPTPIKIITKPIPTMENMRTYTNTSTLSNSESKRMRERLGIIKEYCPVIFGELRRIDCVSSYVIDQYFYNN